MKMPAILKSILLILFIAVFISKCGKRNAPDVSGIAVDVRIARFDKFLFEKTDTSNMAAGLQQLHAAFPYFTPDFLVNILGLPAVNNPATAGDITSSELKRFITITHPLYDSLLPKFADMRPIENDLSTAFKYVKYYFPSYQVPRVVAYLGPFNAPGIAITNEALAVGLQLYAGRNFSFYNTKQGIEMFPAYISRGFEAQYIPANAMKAVVEDIFPDNSKGRPLIEQMITKGRQWWMLSKIMPSTADSLKTGYTTRQLAWCNGNEGLIWTYMLKNTDMYTTEPALIKDYIGEAPKTPDMPDESPGNIGQWLGWRIVQKYESRYPDLKPEEIMKISPAKIFAEAKYKPR